MDLHPMRLISPLSIPLLFVACAGLSAAEVAVFNPSIGAANPNIEQIKDLLRGRRTAWEDGSKVIVALSRDDVSDGTLTHILGVNSQQFTIAWKKLVFTGKATMPEMFDTEDELVAFVARTPGAVGLVDKGKTKDGVKVIPLE